MAFRNMDMDSRQPLVINGRHARRTAALCGFLFCLLLRAAPLHALDPNKHLTQYIHTAWRTQDGALPSGMFSVAQTSDGFLWFTPVSQGMYRFDGIRFIPWTLPVDGRTIDHILSVYSDHAGGLWAVGEHEVFHLKGGVVVSHFALEGTAKDWQHQRRPRWLVVDAASRFESASTPLPCYRP